MGSRIGLTDTHISAIAKMSDGNPDALSAMMQIMQEHDNIDTEAMFGGLGAIMLLDTWEIYGSDIYVLFNDKCDRDVRRMLLLMRATQLGLFSESRLRELASDQVNLTPEEWDDIDKKVCNRLEGFARPAKEVNHS